MERRVESFNPPYKPIIVTSYPYQTSIMELEIFVDDKGREELKDLFKSDINEILNQKNSFQSIKAILPL